MGDFSDVWSVDAFDRFVANGIRVPLVRLVRDGTPLPITEYSGTGRFGGRTVQDAIRPSRVAELYSAGATVVAQSLHRTQDSVRGFVRALSSEVSHPVQANSYLTPPGSVGLAPHRDAHDVLVLQVGGAKHWSVDGLGDVELAPGDVLYLPAGTEHSAAATTNMSLHLTIGVMRVTYRAVLQRLLRDGPEILDHPLPLRYREDPNLEDHVAEAIDRVTSFLAASEAGDVVRRERRRAVQEIPGDGDLATAVAIGTLRTGSTIARGPGTWTLEDTGNGRIRVASSDAYLDAPAVCRPALEQLCVGRPVEIDTLQGLDAASRLVLARRLVGSGLCRIVDTAAGPTERVAPLSQVV